ncbi:MAG: hypothetical protein PHG85_04975 [Candidatus Altiarchaeota archaeon]|nr:hypothetical protein [Candidatus Altiarchaeota archaeon]
MDKSNFIILLCIVAIISQSSFSSGAHAGAQQSVQVICKVLNDIATVIITIILGIGIAMFIPLLLAGCVLYILMKGTNARKLIIKTTIILLAGVVVATLLTAGIAYAIIIFKTGGTCQINIFG